MNYLPLVTIPLIPQPRLSGVGQIHCAIDLNRDGAYDTTSLEGELRQGLEPLVEMRGLRSLAISKGKHLLTSADLNPETGPRLIQWSGGENRDNFLRTPAETFPQLEQLRVEADRQAARQEMKLNFSGPADWGINMVDEQFLIFRPMHDLT